MAATVPGETLSAPERIVSDSRAEFRKECLGMVERAVQVGSPAVSIDLASTTEVDASGLGILVLTQKRCAESGLALRLLNVPSQVKYLLVLTKLDHLFELA